MTTPLALPADFNPDTLMLARTTEYGLFHETRRAARLAAQLLANGSREDCDLAERILRELLNYQERDPRDPHLGNFYWMREDSHVEDLNAVEFVLEALIPMIIRHGERLSPETRAWVLESIRLGLAAIERLDVSVAYTNITGLDVVNSCLGGEALGDAAIAARGYRKLAAWIEQINRSGHPLEYNSPTYTAVTIRALKVLTDLVQDERTKQAAQALAARLALSVALHIHAATGRWAGPHGRAYQPSVVCETPPEVEMVRAWIADGTVPAWVGDGLDAQGDGLTVVETAERAHGLVISTHLAPEYALGVASRSFHPQANVCMLHYVRPGAERPGVLYTRYILDDKWFGDAYHATDRTKTRNLPDEGEFCAVHQGARAIGIYSLTGRNQFHSAKAALIWTQVSHIDEIRVGDQRIEALPTEIPAGVPVVVASGEVYVALRPLLRSALGKEAPARLVERAGDLVLELFNYQGPEKRFWELNWPGAFFQGRPFCAFYLEVAPRTAYASTANFAQALASGKINEALAAPYTYQGEGERQYTVSYARDGQELGITMDVMTGKTLRRWTQPSQEPAGDALPMLESAIARQSAGGEVTVGEASVRCSHGPVWLFANAKKRRWVAGYLGLAPATLEFTTPEGSKTVDLPGAATVVWQNEIISH
ncbi:MAG: hypothetical protein IT328_14895 [Caldilineaceae bacterium]|nr:hypothetical protein [Caldilineaceae bacterium]